MVLIDFLSSLSSQENRSVFDYEGGGLNIKKGKGSGINIEINAHSYFS
jgi:hypothetical protein